MVPLTQRDRVEHRKEITSGHLTVGAETSLREFVRQKIRVQLGLLRLEGRLVAPREVDRAGG